MYLNELDKEKYILIEADNSNYQYMGRVDFENPKSPTIIYAGSMIKTKFTGTSINSGKNTWRKRKASIRSVTFHACTIPGICNSNHG